jgi:hypothetical protein
LRFSRFIAVVFLRSDAFADYTESAPTIQAFAAENAEKTENRRKRRPPVSPPLRSAATPV